MLVQAPKHNLPLLNDNIGVAHLLHLSILDGERGCGLILLKKEEKSLRTLKERARLWPRTISAELKASTNWNYLAVWEEIKQ